MSRGLLSNFVTVNNTIQSVIVFCISLNYKPVRSNRKAKANLSGTSSVVCYVRLFVVSSQRKVSEGFWFGLHIALNCWHFVLEELSITWICWLRHMTAHRQIAIQGVLCSVLWRRTSGGGQCYYPPRRTENKSLLALFFVRQERRIDYNFKWAITGTESL